MGDPSILSDLRAQIASIEGGVGPQGASTPFGSTQAPEPEPEVQASQVRSGAMRKGKPARPDDTGLADQGDDAPTRSAFEKIVGLLNASDKSELTLRTRLLKDGYTEAETQEGIERAREYGFIDDDRFARLLIESRIRQGWGSAGIERDLRKNGINADALEGWPWEFPLSHDEELERALALLDRKPPRSKNLREGAYRKAVQKGFPTAIASSAARIWSERREQGRA